jgi:hypothetical protein
MTKTCAKCKQTLSVADFNLNDSYKSGIDSKCISCSGIKVYKKKEVKPVSDEVLLNRKFNNAYYQKNKLRIKQKRILREKNKSIVY